MENKKYSDKPRDPRWQKNRLEILERDEWMCRRCHDKENTLHVHHMKYIPGNNPWEYDKDTLITLCANCHESETTERPSLESYLLDMIKVNLFMADDVETIATGFNGLNSKYPPDVTSVIIRELLSNPKLWTKACDDYFNEIRERCE
ncbi:MAG: HNH endonuclease [Deltaproteobacteria bacterium]